MGVSKDQRDRARTAALENAPILFSVDEWDDAAYALIPQWLRERILARIEPAAAQPAPTHFDDEEIPF